MSSSGRIAYAEALQYAVATLGAGLMMPVSIGIKYPEQFAPQLEKISRNWEPGTAESIAVRNVKTHKASEAMKCRL